MVAHPLCLKCRYWGGDGLCMIRYDEDLYPNLSEDERIPLLDDPINNDECPYQDIALEEEEEEYYEEGEEDW